MLHAGPESKRPAGIQVSPGFWESCSKRGWPTTSDMSARCAGPSPANPSSTAVAVTSRETRPMTAPVFVDSNVFLYALDDADPRKQRLARAWRDALWTSRLGRVSFQVLGEFYVNALRLHPKALDDTRAEIRDLLAGRPVVTDAALLEHGWKLQDRYQLSYWDSLIVAASKAASCGYLLTEDLQAGQKLDGIEVVSPFLTDLASLGQLTLPGKFALLPPIRRARCHRLAVESVPVIGFGAEVQVGRAQLFGLTQEEISAWFQVEMQTLHQCDTLCPRELRQHVHTKDAIEPADVHRLGQVHGVERDQAAQPRLHQEVRTIVRIAVRSIGQSVPRLVLRPFGAGVRCS